MTAKQKANQARFKKVVAEAKKLRNKNPKLTQAQAVKQAWAMTYSKKDVSVSGYHKDTKSHNVNIKVVSGIKISRKPGKIGALPIDFTGSVLGLRFRVYNQFNLDGTVTLQIVENRPGGDLIANVDGRTGEVETATNKFWGKIDGKERQLLGKSGETKVKKTIKDFIQNLHKEVKEYNSGKDTRTKKGQRLNVKATPKVSKGPKDQIKDILRTEKKRLKYGYTIVPGKVMSGVYSPSSYVFVIRLEKVVKEIAQREEVINSVKSRRKELVEKNGKMWYNKWLRDAKKIVTQLKQEKTKLKSFI
jgi:hypothetical protein